MAKRKVMRTQFLVYPNFQMTLIVLNTVVLLGMAVAVGYASKTAFGHLNDVGLQIHLYPTHPFFQMVTAYTHHFYGFLFFTLASCLIFSNALIVYLTHRATGPIIQMENYFKNIVKRERAPRRQLRFRQNDYFRELPYVINSAVGILRAGVSEDTQTISNIRKQK